MRGTHLLVVSMAAACAAHPGKPGFETPPPSSTTGPGQPFDDDWERAEPKRMTAEERVRYDLKVAKALCAPIDSTWPNERPT